jgi:hypothetical protein
VVGIAPGATDTIDGLKPGTYTVALEGYAGALVEVFGQVSGLQVQGGQRTLATVDVDVFQPELYVVPSPRGLEVNVDLVGAESYLVEWADNDTFLGASDTVIRGGLVEVDPGGTGRYYVRARGRRPSGVQGKPGYAGSVDIRLPFFVSPGGSDANPGTRTQPFATIQWAIDRAAATGAGGDLFIAADTYALSLGLKPRVSLYGGFDPTSWTRQPGATVVVMGGATAVIGVAADSLTIDGLTIRSANASASGESSVGIALDSSVGVVIGRNVIVAGNGAAGLDRPDRVQADTGAKGANAGTGSIWVPGGGGIGGGFSGGDGGRGGGGNGTSGDPGMGPAGGSIGLGGAGGNASPIAGGNGGDGGPGADGSPGVSGSGFGDVVALAYAPADGVRGNAAEAGSGGGGAGGGGEYCAPFCTAGGGGGGGGAGGARGLGGLGGGGGGASIGVVVTGASQVTLHANNIATGRGGQGGRGGAGGAGGPGGGGGRGVKSPAAHASGGDGGAGGQGGRGGDGGGGGGGPTVGVAEDGSSTSNLTAADLAGNTITLGPRGAGGQHANPSLPDGAFGERVAYKKL